MRRRSEVAETDGNHKLYYEPQWSLAIVPGVKTGALAITAAGIEFEKLVGQTVRGSGFLSTSSCGVKRPPNPTSTSVNNKGHYHIQR